MIDAKYYLFPFPLAVNRERQDGSILKWPTTCTRCDHRVCMSEKTDALSLCSYGYNFQRIHDGIVVAGVILRDSPFNNQGRGKRMRLERQNLVTREMFDAATTALRQLISTGQKSIEEEKQKILGKYLQEHQYEPEFLALIKPQIEKGLSFVHDYKQINTQIGQNINVIIETRYTGGSFDEKLRQTTQQERAIYEASKFLDEKLSVAKFLMHPEWLDSSNECVKFSFHKLVYKYLQIYKPRFERKGIHPVLMGSSYAEVVANPEAVSVIPHTLIDNAAKYSPNQGKVEIFANDIQTGIEFSVSSFGPRIFPEEEERIFSPFYRGKAAQQVEEEGAGYGLYICQLIATKHLGTKVSVQQDQKHVPRMGYWTTFHVQLPLQALIAR